jgi:hypothetical protein
MTEYQKIAIGLLALTHPEIYLSLGNKANKPAQSVSPMRQQASTLARRRSRRAKRVNAVLRALKFALAALLAGSRAVPLGDNRQLTKELGAYGAKLR